MQETTFDEAAGGMPKETFAGSRLLVVSGQPEARKRLALALRQMGATVALASPDQNSIEHVRDLDPEVVVVDSSDPENVARTAPIVGADDRLKWASLLPHDFTCWRDGETGDLKALARDAEPLLATERALRERLADTDLVETPLSRIGPSRVVRMLTGTRLPFRVTVRCEEARVDLEVVDGRVANARWVDARSMDADLAGAAAVGALRTLGAGLVEIERGGLPSSGDDTIPRPLPVHVVAAARRPRAMDPGTKPTAPGFQLPRLVDSDLAEESYDDQAPTRPAKKGVVTKVRPPPDVVGGFPRATTASPSVRPERAGGVGWAMRVGTVVVLAAIGTAGAIVFAPGGGAEPLEPVAAAPAPANPTARVGAPIRRHVGAPVRVERQEGRLVPPPQSPSDRGAGESTVPPPGSSTTSVGGRTDRHAAQRLVERARAATETDPEEAEALFRQALERHAVSPRALAGLAELCLRTGRASEAEDLARRAVDLAPRRASYRVLWGDALRAIGDAAGARGQWQEGLDRAPGSARIRRRLETLTE